MYVKIRKSTGKNEMKNMKWRFFIFYFLEFSTWAVRSLKIPKLPKASQKLTNCPKPPATEGYEAVYVWKCLMYAAVASVYGAGKNIIS